VRDRGDGLGHMRLTDAGLSGQQHDSPLTDVSRPNGGSDLIDELLPAEYGSRFTLVQDPRRGRQRLRQAEGGKR
jgi:hypothetical protein